MRLGLMHSWLTGPPQDLLRPTGDARPMGHGRRLPTSWPAATWGARACGCRGAGPTVISPSDCLS